jgi:DNA-binding FadR family transcriptional regulator
MKVSLAVVNGGISRLASRGFVRIAPRKGVFVEDYLRNGNISTLESILEYSENYFREDLLSAIMDFRRQFELKFTELACISRTAVNLQNLGQLVDAFAREEDHLKASILAFRFHQEVAVASGNMVYPLIVGAFRELYCKSYFRMFTIQGKDRTARKLGQLLEAIRLGDTGRASELTLLAVDNWQESFHAHYRDGEMFRQ